MMPSEASEPPAHQVAHQNDRLLSPKGDITIFEAAEFKDALVKLLANDGLVSLNLGGVVRVDTAAIQLLLAARKQGRMFVMGMSEDLQTRLTQLGFTEPLSE